MKDINWWKHEAKNNKTTKQDIKNSRHRTKKKRRNL